MNKNKTLLYCILGSFLLAMLKSSMDSSALDIMRILINVLSTIGFYLYLVFVIYFLLINIKQLIKLIKNNER